MIVLNKEGSRIWKAIEYIVYIFIATFPFINYSSFLYSGTSSRSVNLIFISTLVGISFALYLFKKETTISRIKSPIFIVLSLYLLSLVISAILGLDFSNSFFSTSTRMSGIWYLLNLGLYIFILSRLMSDRVIQNRIILITIISTAVYSFLYLCGPEGWNIFFKGYSSYALTFGNSSFAAMYIFGAFVLSIYHLFQAEIKKWWMYVIPVFIISNPAIISTAFVNGSLRDGLVGDAKATAYVVVLSFVTLFMFWMISKIKDFKTKKIVIYSLFGIYCLSLVFMAVSLLSNNGILRNLYLKHGSEARPLVWEMSEKAISQRPYFGWGTDNFERVFEKNYDNRLLQDEYDKEAWFDRAHNVFIDQLVDNGFVGLIAYLSVYLTILYLLIKVSLYSNNKNDKILSVFIIAYLPLHFLELQTSFDTTISYVIFALMISLSIVLVERMNVGMVFALNVYTKYIIATLIVIFFVASFIFSWIPLVRSQMINGYIRTVGSSEGRMSSYTTFLASPVDTHSLLWKATNDLKKGISDNPTILQDPKKVQSLVKELVFLEKSWKEYVTNNPDHFRAKLNLADILMYENLFGIDKLKEAQDLLDTAIKLVPQAPQSYWMKSVAYLYAQNFSLANEYAKKGLVLNDKIKESQDVVIYISKSIKDFPNIDLFNFKQI